MSTLSILPEVKTEQADIARDTPMPDASTALDSPPSSSLSPPNSPPAVQKHHQLLMTADHSFTPTGADDAIEVDASAASGGSPAESTLVPSEPNDTENSDTSRPKQHHRHHQNELEGALEQDVPPSSPSATPTAAPGEGARPPYGLTLRTRKPRFSVPELSTTRGATPTTSTNVSLKRPRSPDWRSTTPATQRWICRMDGCTNDYFTAHSLSRHQVDVHGLGKKVEDDDDGQQDPLPPKTVMRQNKGDPNKDSRFRDGRWYCDYGGCGKSYLGFKEMLRHGLNHTKPEYKCKYCWREWHRNDVYLQHFERKPDCKRAREKEDEGLRKAAKVAKQPHRPMDSRARYVCGLNGCMRDYATRGNLGKHQIQTHGKYLKPGFSHTSVPKEVRSGRSAVLRRYSEVTDKQHPKTESDDEDDDEGDGEGEGEGEGEGDGEGEEENPEVKRMAALPTPLLRPVRSSPRSRNNNNDSVPVNTAGPSGLSGSGSSLSARNFITNGHGEHHDRHDQDDEMRNVESDAESDHAQHGRLVPASAVMPMVPVAIADNLQHLHLAQLAEVADHERVYGNLVRVSKQTGLFRSVGIQTPDDSVPVAGAMIV